MPVVVRIARQLYLQRIEEVKENLKKDAESFGKLAEEIESIKSGEWDQKLSEASSSSDITLSRNNDSELTDKTEEVNSSDIVAVEETMNTANQDKAITLGESKVVENTALLENRMKRTSSETVITTSNNLKRCRLEEGSPVSPHHESNESQVVFASISDATAPMSDDSNVFSVKQATSPQKADTILMQEEELQPIKTEDISNEKQNHPSAPHLTYESGPSSIPVTSLTATIPTGSPVAPTTQTANIVVIDDKESLSPELASKATMLTEAIQMINMANRIAISTEPANQNAKVTELINEVTKSAESVTTSVAEDTIEQNNMGTGDIISTETENEQEIRTNKTNNLASPMEGIVTDQLRDTPSSSNNSYNYQQRSLMSNKLPNIVIPEASTSSYHKSYYDQSGKYF